MKSLAGQAKQAPDNISVEISTLNTISGEVGAALGGIRGAIWDVNEFVATAAPHRRLARHLRSSHRVNVSLPAIDLNQWLLSRTPIVAW
jgi:hypothetical protein